MVFPRWYHAVRAFLSGYFWLPCPICGKNFGGHEWRVGDGSDIWSGSEAEGMAAPSGGEGVCPRCKDKANKINKHIIPSNRFGRVGDNC